MTREQAIEVARTCAKAQKSFYSEPFWPDEWVISAILMAAGKTVELKNPGEHKRGIVLTKEQEQAQREAWKVFLEPLPSSCANVWDSIKDHEMWSVHEEASNQEEKHTKNT